MWSTFCVNCKEYTGKLCRSLSMGKTRMIIQAKARCRGRSGSLSFLHWCEVSLDCLWGEDIVINLARDPVTRTGKYALFQRRAMWSVFLLNENKHEVYKWWRRRWTLLICRESRMRSSSSTVSLHLYFVDNPILPWSSLNAPKSP